MIIEQLKAKNASTLNDYAEAMDSQVDTVRFVDFNTENITSLGNEPVINAYAAYGPLNSVVGPLKGDRGVFALKVINREQSEEEYNAVTVKSQLQSNTMYRLQSQAVEVLKEKMKVADYRYKFY